MIVCHNNMRSEDGNKSCIVEAQKYRIEADSRPCSNRSTSREERECVPEFRKLQNSALLLVISFSTVFRANNS